MTNRKGAYKPHSQVMSIVPTNFPMDVRPPPRKRPRWPFPLRKIISYRRSMNLSIFND